MDFPIHTKRLIPIWILLLVVHLLPAQNFTNIKEKKPFDAGGSIALNTSFFTSSGNDNYPFGKTDPFQWSIVGTPWISIYEFTIPFTFTVGKQVKSFEHPFYQFGTSPTYKWLTVHAGYRNMTFNPYTLNGHTFLGGGVEMNPGKFRFKAMAGILSPAVELDTTKEVIEEPSYKRFGYGASLGFGTESNYADIMFFKAKDKVGSIADLPMEEMVTPGENLSIGLTTEQKIVDALSWYADLGVSFYTRDQEAETFYEDKDNIFPDFIFPGEQNVTSRANLAAKTGIDVRIKSFSMNAEYERVAPEYETMGSYYFSNDFNKLKFTPSASMAKNKVRFNTMYAIQWNNLKNTRLQTTYNSNAVLSVDVNPVQKFGFTTGYSNFYIFQKEGAIPLVDSVAIDMMTHVVTFVPRLTFVKPEFIQNYVLSMNYQTLTDQNSSTEKFTETNSLNVVLNGVFNWIKAKHTLNGGLNFLRTDSPFTTNLKYGVSAGYSTKLAKDQVNIRLQTNMSLSRADGASNGHSETLSGTVTYNIKKQHSFSFNATLLNNSFKVMPGYREFRGAASYVFTIDSLVKDKEDRKRKKGDKQEAGTEELLEEAPSDPVE